MELTLGPNFNCTPGSLFLILNNANSGSSYSELFNQGLSITVDGDTFDILYGANYDQNGNFVSLTGGNNIALEAVAVPVNISDYTCTPKVCGNLSAGAWVSGSSAIQHSHGHMQTIVAQDLRPISAYSRRFMRLKVTRVS